jgi:class 3 adenylate cyclase
MFTDMVDSTRMKGLIEGETSGRRDTYFRSHIKEPHDAVVLACVYEAGGYIVNPTGDGFCITFVDAEEAVLCALRIQQHLTQHPISTPLGNLQIRIGLHTGIAGPSGDDYIASTVDKTARVQGKAGGGEVFVSHQTQVLVSDKTQGVQFEPRGIFDLKGLQAEELYQAVPHPKLVLPPISDEALASPQLNDFESSTYLPNRVIPAWEVRKNGG